MTKEKSFKINIILNIIKQICAIIFPMITFPYVSRVLGATAYGKVNFSASIVSYFSLIAGLGVYIYAVREGSKIIDDKNSFNKFVSEVFSINVYSTIVAYLGLFLLIITSHNIETYRLLILILSINILLNTLSTEWINVIYEDFLYFTVRYIICQTIAVVATFIFIKGPGDLVLYAFISNSGITIANIINLFYIRYNLKIKISLTLSINAKRHLKPIIILFANMISSTIYMNSDSTMLGIIIGDIAVGYYTVSTKIYSIVKQLLNAVATVAIPKFSNYTEISTNINTLNKQFNNLLGSILMFVLPAVTGLLCVGKEIILLISGEEYLPALSALNILSIALIFATVANIYISVIMLAIRKDKEILIATTISAVVNIILNFILIPKYSYNAAAFTTMLSEFIILITGISYTKNIVKAQFTFNYVIGLLGSIWVVVISLLLKRNFVNSMMYLFSTIGISILGYIVILMIFKKKIQIFN